MVNILDLVSSNVFDESRWTTGRGAGLASQYKLIVLVMCCIYIPCIRILQTFMKNKAPLKLTPIVFLWNIFLGVASTFGFLWMLRDDISIVYTWKYPEENFFPRTRLVVAAFCLSKVGEFFDTIILVLKKREVSFLHLYHHLTVALYCFHSQYYNVDFAHAFVLMNLFVHSLMYLYFAASSIKRWSFLTAIKPTLTMLQILQMLAGAIISTVSLCDPANSSGSPQWWNSQLGLIMYISYAFLFVAFYINSYCKGLRGRMCSFLGMMHAFAIVGLARICIHESSKRLLLECITLYLVSGIGITCGAHRLWAHRSYKAAFPFRVVLLVLNSIANQGSIYHWSRDHRVHHKYSEEESDPHNASLGFFYSHMGWLLVEKPQVVKNAGREIDCTDLLADPLVRLQYTWDPWWNQIFCFVLPSLYARYMYGSFWLGFFTVGCFRWIVCLHATWTVNSVAHLWGDRPYNPDIGPRESVFTALVAVGEGWHNWHHQYPFDYAASEGGIFTQFNPSKFVLDVAAALGLVWDRKRATHLWEQAKMKRMKAEIESAERAVAEAAANKSSMKRMPSFKDSLPAHCMKKSLLRSTLNLIRDLGICATIAAVAILIRESPVGTFCSETMFVNQLVNVILWTVYAVAQGTVGFGIWVLAYEAAGGRFSDYRVVNHIVGIALNGILMIPYQPRRAHRYMERNRASLSRSLSEDSWAIFKTPTWASWGSGFFFAIFFASLYLMWGATFGWYQMFKWYLGPWIVLNCWVTVYHWLLENGPHDSTEIDVSGCTFEYFTADWLQSTWAKATRGRRYPWTRLVDHLHHHLSLTHVVQAVDFDVPHYHVKEAIKRIGEVLEEFRSEIEDAKMQLINAGKKAARSDNIISSVAQTRVFSAR